MPSHDDLTIRAFFITTEPLDAITPKGRTKVLPVAFEDFDGVQVVNMPAGAADALAGPDPEPPAPLRRVK